MGEDRRIPEDRTEELIAELRDRVRALEEANRENRRIIASLTSHTPERLGGAAPAPRRMEPERSWRRIGRSWWKERFGAAMVGVMAAFAVLAANGEENPLRLAKLGGGEEQARAPTTEPAPQPSGGGGGGGGGAYEEPAPAYEEPAPTNTTTEPAPVASEPAPEPVPANFTEPEMIAPASPDLQP